MTDKEKEQKAEELFLKYEINAELFPNGDVINAYKAGVFDALVEINNLLKEAYNQAIDDAADNANADFTEIDRGENSLPLIEVYVIKDSILKLKK